MIEKAVSLDQDPAMLDRSMGSRSSWTRSRRNRYIALFITIVGALLYFEPPFYSSHPNYVDPKFSTFVSNASSSHPGPQDPAAKDMWRSLAETLYKTKPSFPEIERVNNHSPWITFNRVKQEFGRPDYLTLTYEQVAELKKNHQDAIADFKTLAPKIPFVKGTRGIVTTAGNDALPILTTSLWILRASGSKLPVEIWMETSEKFDRKPCEDIFPSLGAKCMFMNEYLPDDLEHPIHIVKFTYKTLALLFSSFEQILFLDCDAFPVNNPDSIFVTEPFVSHGLVTWPDYWASTASHYWYDISGLPESDLKERATTESGALLINKETHAAVLLLVQFYNVWGPEHWHRLFSQSAPGEGDKDTFLAAAQMYKLPWYQLAENPQRVGYRCNGVKHAIGSGQSHPYDDWKIVSNGVMTHEEGLDITESIHPRILFIHGNLPKLDPYILLDWNLEELDWVDMLHCDRGKGPAHRLWGPQELHIAKYGWDVERAAWDGMRWEACVHEEDYEIWTVGSIFRHTEDLRHDLCDKVSAQWNALFPGEKWDKRLPRPGRKERPWNGWNNY